MSHNIPLRIPCPVHPRLVSIGIMVFIFMATNPVMTKANVHAQGCMQGNTPKYSKFISIFPVRKPQGPGSGSERFKGNQTPVLKGQFTDSAAISDVAIPGASIPSAAVLEMIALVNQERMDAGLTKLEIDTTLMKLAGEKCWDMARFNYFGHNSKRLGTIYEQLGRAQFEYQKAAENIIGAPNFTRAIQTVLSSPAHRSNILNPRFRKVGIGIVKGGQYGEIIVQIFTG